MEKPKINEYLEFQVCDKDYTFWDNFPRNKFENDCYDLMIPIEARGLAIRFKEEAQIAFDYLRDIRNGKILENDASLLEKRVSSINAYIYTLADLGQTYKDLTYEVHPYFEQTSLLYDTILLELSKKIEIIKSKEKKNTNKEENIKYLESKLKVFEVNTIDLYKAMLERDPSCWSDEEFLEIQNDFNNLQEETKRDNYNYKLIIKSNNEYYDNALRYASEINKILEKEGKKRKKNARNSNRRRFI